VQPVTRGFWIAMAVVCLVLAGMAVHQASLGQVFNWMVAAIAVLAIFGLVRRVRWGRRTAVGLQIVLLLLGFSMVMPPEPGVPVPGPPQPVETAMLHAAVAVGVALLCLHLLGHYKKSFRDAWF
jgi:hypothetical protein